MKLDIALFGAFREFEAQARVQVEVPDDATVAEVRAALLAHGQAHWPGFRAGLLQRSAFASPSRVLRESDAIEAGVMLTVLPPVGGG
jgi:molybdopterin synthase sulfur carrier subunit